MSIELNPSHIETRKQTVGEVFKNNKATTGVTVACLAASIGLAIILGIGKTAAIAIASAVVISPWGLVVVLVGVALVGTVCLILKYVKRRNQVEASGQKNQAYVDTRASHRKDTHDSTQQHIDDLRARNLMTDRAYAAYCAKTKAAQ